MKESVALGRGKFKEEKIVMPKDAETTLVKSMRKDNRRVEVPTQLLVADRKKNDSQSKYILDAENKG